MKENLLKKRTLKKIAVATGALAVGVGVITTFASFNEAATESDIFWDELVVGCTQIETIPISVTTYSNYTGSGQGSVATSGGAVTGLTLGASGSGTTYSQVTAMASALSYNATKAEDCVTAFFAMCDRFACARPAGAMPSALLYNGKTYTIQ